MSVAPATEPSLYLGAANFSDNKGPYILISFKGF